MDKKIALISGITGQERFIPGRVPKLKKDMKYTAFCVVRHRSNTGRIEHLYLDEWDA